MKKVRVQEAVGMVLCHDITKVIPGQFKGRAYKKGHVINIHDIPELLKLGKDHIFVWENQDGLVHENEAAQRLGTAIAGDGVQMTEPNQGKVNLIASHKGLLKINQEALTDINTIDQLMAATRHTNFLVEKGDVVAGTKIIPLMIEEEKLKEVENIGQRAEKIVTVKKLNFLKVGMVTTGNEVYYGRIKDSFGLVIRDKMSRFDSQVIDQIFVPDDSTMISRTIKKLVNQGAQLIITTGGMSVDPDDVTPAGVKMTGAEIISYGSPVLPGAMFMLAYLGNIPVLGLPACVMCAKTTVLDLLLPRIFAGEKITRKDLAVMGHGGLCFECEVCRYPVCPFGRGV